MCEFGERQSRRAVSGGKVMVACSNDAQVFMSGESSYVVVAEV